MVKGLVPQRIIQGKSYSLRLKFDADNLAKFNKMWFSCSKLDIVKEMTLDSETGIYTFSLTWEETQELDVVDTTFNITVQLVGSEKKRDLANGVPLTIEQNRNPVSEES